MNIYAKSGHKVVAKYLDWGYNTDVITANNYLKQDGIYTVSFIDIHSCISYVYLEEIPTIAFNSVHFEDLEEDE